MEALLLILNLESLLVWARYHVKYPVRTEADNYMVAQQFLDPLAKLDRLTIRIRDEDGNTIKNPSSAGNNFLVLRFVCKKSNLK